MIWIESGGETVGARVARCGLGLGGVREARAGRPQGYGAGVVIPALGRDPPCHGPPSSSSRPWAGIHHAAGGAAGEACLSLAARWAPERVRGDEEGGSRDDAATRRRFTRRREGAKKVVRAEARRTRRGPALDGGPGSAARAGAWRASVNPVDGGATRASGSVRFMFLDADGGYDRAHHPRLQGQAPARGHTLPRLRLARDRAARQRPADVMG